MVRKPRTYPRLIEPKGRPHLECPKCHVCVVWPDALTLAQAAAFADVARRSRLEGAQYAHQKLGLDLREAKALAMHVIRTKGTCHRCESQVIGPESVCAKCRSVNLNW
jgi:hypothetical protein